MKTHGMRRTPTYRSWCEMRQRCNNPNSDKYKWYGARGILVCERWNKSFENFLADMGERPVEQTLDRIDTNGHYEPGNCRWATKKMQMNNMSTNRVLRIAGETRTMTEWSEASGVSVGTIWRRLQLGWCPAHAVQVPVRPHKQYERTQQANARAEGKVG